MGELLFFSWTAGIVSAWDAQNFLMLILPIGGPVVFLLIVRVASRPQAMAACLTRAWKASEPVSPPVTMPKPIERSEAPEVAAQVLDEWRPIQGEGILEGFELGESEPRRVPADERLVQLQLELHRLRVIVEAFEGDAVARLKGRVVSWRRNSGAIAVPNGIGHQFLFVQVPDESDRDELPVGVVADLACRWSDSRLVVERVIETMPARTRSPSYPSRTRPTRPRRTASSRPSMTSTSRARARAGGT